MIYNVLSPFRAMAVLDLLLTFQFNTRLEVCNAHFLKCGKTSLENAVHFLFHCLPEAFYKLAVPLKTSKHMYFMYFRNRQKAFRTNC